MRNEEGNFVTNSRVHGRALLRVSNSLARRTPNWYSSSLNLECSVCIKWFHPKCLGYENHTKNDLSNLVIICSKCQALKSPEEESVLGKRQTPVIEETPEPPKTVPEPPQETIEPPQEPEKQSQVEQGVEDQVDKQLLITIQLTQEAMKEAKQGKARQIASIIPQREVEDDQMIQENFQLPIVVKLSPPSSEQNSLENGADQQQRCPVEPQTASTRDEHLQPGENVSEPQETIKEFSFPLLN